MRIYILDKNNTLVLNGEVFVLAREKKVSDNCSCNLCALGDKCTDYESILRLSTLCMPNKEDGRWFFLNCEELSESDKRDILWNIEKCLDIDF